MPTRTKSLWLAVPGRSRMTVAAPNDRGAHTPGLFRIPLSVHVSLYVVCLLAERWAASHPQVRFVTEKTVHQHFVDDYCAHISDN